MGKKLTKILSKRPAAYFAVFLFLFSLSVSFLNTVTVYAKAPLNTNAVKNGTYTWYDRWTIHMKIGGEQYYARYESSFDLNLKDSDCDGKIELPKNVYGPTVEKAPSSVKVDIDVTGAYESSACTDTSPNEIPNIAVDNPGALPRAAITTLSNFNIFFRVSSDGRQLVWAQDASQPYTQSSDKADIFLRDSENGDKCQDIIQVNKAAGTYESYELKDGGSGPKPPASINANPDCRISEDSPDYAPVNTALKLGDADKLKNDANPDPTAPGATGGDGTPACTGEGLSLGWILCPIVEAASNFGDLVFKQVIRPMMEQNVLSLNSDDPFYKSWQGFRFLGNVLLIGSLLAIVYSQTRGGS